MHDNIKEQDSPRRPAPLVIGDITLKNNLIMAPMAGITDLPFRTLAKEGGAGLVCTEMVSARALAYGDRKTLQLFTLSEQERPVSVQIFGSEPGSMAEAAKIVAGGGADIVDINMGCPVPKIVKSGAGARLIEGEALPARIMEAVVKSVRVPVTVKIRIGKNTGDNIAPRIIRLAGEAGVKMAVVHGRPASAGHSGKPDLKAVAEAVQGARIPVVGNGGITDELTAREFIAVTGCAGLMIGRSAIGDPGLFTRIEHFLSSGEVLPAPTWEDRIGYLKRHAALSAAYYGENTGIIILRKVAPFYLKGLPNASRIRNSFNAITKLDELEGLLSSIWESPYFSGIPTIE
ncbi:MAG: tRNA dihydrouridine synthase DusB [Endomicrobiales bacterium]